MSGGIPEHICSTAQRSSARLATPVHLRVNAPAYGPSSPEPPCPLNLQFLADLTKAEEVDGKLYLVGVASDTSTDKQRERMSTSALADMAKTAVGQSL